MSTTDDSNVSNEDILNDPINDIDIPPEDETELLNSVTNEEVDLTNEDGPPEPKIEVTGGDEQENEEKIEAADIMTISDVPSLEKQLSKSSHLTTYKGKPVRYIELTGSKIDVPAASIYTPGAVSLIVDGTIDSFRVSCNDSNFRIFCQLRDHEGGVRTIMNETVDELALDGAGMTSGEIDADVTSSAMDKTGTYDPVNPYIMRGKNQFSGMEVSYEANLGTVNDKYLVVNYSPINQLEFARIEFFIENTSTEGTRRVHKYKLKYMEFVSEEVPIPDKYVLPSELEKEGITIDISGDDPELNAITQMATESITGKETFLKETLRKAPQKDISIEVVEDTDEGPINVA